MELVDSRLEQAVLGACLIEGSGVGVGVVRNILAGAHDFFDRRHGIVWEAMVSVVDAGLPLDVLTLGAELKARDRLSVVGGPGFLGELTDSLPTDAHLHVHAGLLAELGVRRRLVEAGDKLKGAALDGRLSIAAAVALASEGLRAAGEGPGVAPSYQSPRADVVLPLTDLGNAERLVRRHRGDVRFVGAWRKWLVWDGARFGRDDVGAIALCAVETVRSIARDEASKARDDDERKAVLKWANASESRSSIFAAVGLAECLPGVGIAAAALDADPWLLNVRNGTLDLRTGELRPHRREDLCSKLAPVEWDAGATCPAWDAFLARVQPDPEVRAFVQRLAGYAATGVVREHVLPIHYGSGGNGKGVCADTLLAVLGDYGVQVPVELLMEARGDRHPTERTTLMGRRFAAASEPKEGGALDVALVKALTGGDTISARFMRGDFFEFQPQHKLWFSTNHRPVIKETANAIWRRVLLIPWAVEIPTEQQDHGLKGKLAAEASGILRWVVEGCLAWQREGLNPPEAVKVASAEYRADSDWCGEFLRACATPEPGARTSSRDVYEVFLAWCAANGADKRSQKVLGAALREKKVKSEKSSVVFYVDVRFARPGWEDLGGLDSDPPGDGFLQ